MYSFKELGSLALFDELFVPVRNTMCEEAGMPIRECVENNELSFIRFGIFRLLVRLHELLHMLQHNQVVDRFSK